jgi:phosphate starvation-inducible PhoH-like protein
MARKNKNHENGNGVLSLKPVQPLTDGQHQTFNAFHNEKNLLLHGFAGTGKTFISLYLALRELHEADTDFNKLFIIRSAVPSRDVGFMPGSLEEKLEVFEAPYHAICTELTGKPHAYKDFKRMGLIEFISTSYIRGTTFQDCVLLVDEVQNMDWGELSSIVTRLGENCRVIFSGDFRQSDFRGHEMKSKADVHNFMNVIKNMSNDFEVIEFGTEDIVRSELVKNFILLSNKMGYGN